MDEDWRQRVRERAYAIWQREGSPDGSAEQFWLMAEEELLAEGRGPAQKGEHPPRGEAQLDEAIDESFPASDPPARGGATGAGAPKGARTRQPK